MPLFCTLDVAITIDAATFCTNEASGNLEKKNASAPINASPAPINLIKEGNKIELWFP